MTSTATRADVVGFARSRVDRDEFTAAFNEHHRRAVRLAYLLTSDEHQAEDVVAEAFTKVYRRWRPGGDPRRGRLRPPR